MVYKYEGGEEGSSRPSTRTPGREEDKNCRSAESMGMRDGLEGEVSGVGLDDVGSTRFWAARTEASDVQLTNGYGVLLPSVRLAGPAAAHSCPAVRRYEDGRGGQTDSGRVDRQTAVITHPGTRKTCPVLGNVTNKPPFLNLLTTMYHNHPGRTGGRCASKLCHGTTLPAGESTYRCVSR